MNSFFEWLLNLIREFRFFTIVLPWELGVRTRFGNRIKLWEPGVYFRLPFFDQVHMTNTRLRVCHSSTQTLTTMDGKTLSISFVIGFCITDPIKALQSFQDPEATFAALAGASSAEFVCVKNAVELRSQELANHARLKLEEAARDVITIDFVQTNDFAITRTFRLFNEQWRQGTSTNVDGVR